MSTPSALKNVAAPIADLKPRSLILSGSGVVPLGFVAQGDGTVVVKWASPLDPNNPNESLSVVNGAQYPGQIASIVSSDVDLLFYFGLPGETFTNVGGGFALGGASLSEQEAQTTLLTALAAATDVPLSDVVTELASIVTNTTKTSEIDDNTDQVETLLGQVRDVAATPTSSSNMGAAVSVTVKSGVGVLLGFSVRHQFASSLWFWAFDSLSASGTPLLIPTLIPSGKHIILGSDFFTARGVAFATGLTYGFSTSATAYTAHSTAADCYATVLSQ
jgi:hypothetical protein